VDIRRSVVLVRAATADERARLGEPLGWPRGDDDGVLVFRLAVSALGSARPVEVLEALLGESAVVGCEIVRTGFEQGAPAGAPPGPESDS
jgi:hypothetical protein